MHELDLRRHIQLLAEDHAISVLEGLGHNVATGTYKAKTDLLIDDALKVEVKGSLWVAATKRSGRYQFNTRNHPHVYILYCVNIPNGTFIVPQYAVGNRRNLAIWSRDPREYNGIWRCYFENWDVIRWELKRCQHNHE